MNKLSQNKKTPPAEISCRIYKVAGWLDTKGFDKRIIAIDLKEKDKSFVDEGKRINKDKLLVVDTIFVENHKSIRYFTYCREGEQQKALSLIKGHIVAKVKTYKSEIDALMKFIS